MFRVGDIVEYCGARRYTPEYWYRKPNLELEVTAVAGHRRSISFKAMFAGRVLTESGKVAEVFRIKNMQLEND